MPLIPFAIARKSVLRRLKGDALLQLNHVGSNTYRPLFC